MNEAEEEGEETKKPPLETEYLTKLLDFICPEVEAGMGIPRSPAEILKGDGYCVMNGEAEVVDINGDRVTRFFCLVHLVSWCYAKSSALKSQCWRNSVHRVEVQPFMTAASQVKKQLAWALQQLYCDDTGFTCLANMK